MLARPHADCCTGRPASLNTPSTSRTAPHLRSRMERAAPRPARPPTFLAVRGRDERALGPAAGRSDRRAGSPAGREVSGRGHLSASWAGAGRTDWLPFRGRRLLRDRGGAAQSRQLDCSAPASGAAAVDPGAGAQTAGRGRLAPGEKIRTDRLLGEVRHFLPDTGDWSGKLRHDHASLHRITTKLIRSTGLGGGEGKFIHLLYGGPRLASRHGRSALKQAFTSCALSSGSVRRHAPAFGRSGGRKWAVCRTRLP